MRNVFFLEERFGSESEQRDQQAPVPQGPEGHDGGGGRGRRLAFDLPPKSTFRAFGVTASRPTHRAASGSRPFDGVRIDRTLRVRQIWRYDGAGTALHCTALRCAALLHYCTTPHGTGRRADRERARKLRPVQTLTGPRRYARLRFHPCRRISRLCPPLAPSAIATHPPLQLPPSPRLFSRSPSPRIFFFFSATNHFGRESARHVLT